MAILDLTEAAAEKAKTLLAASPRPDGALRVAVRNGGCSGMRYELLFDGDPGDDDTEMEFFGLRVFVDAESAGFLDMNDAGFKIQNPNASETCGCGESFAL